VSLDLSKIEILFFEPTGLAHAHTKRKKESHTRASSEENCLQKEEEEEEE
jgi:hypothetical protein